MSEQELLIGRDLSCGYEGIAIIEHVDLGEETFSASTHDVGELDYTLKQQVLDAMIATLELQPPPG
jgi:hypothetical protein